MFRPAVALAILALVAATAAPAADPARRVSPVVGLWETANAASCGGGNLYAEFTADGRYETWTAGIGKNVVTTAKYKVDGNKIHFTGTGESAGETWTATIEGPVGDFLFLKRGFAFTATKYVRRSKE